MASPRFDGSPEHPSLSVHRLEPDCGDYESVVMVKLTDEICSALLTAQRKGLPIRIHVDEQGGKWELGDHPNGSQVFRYQQQALPGPPTDAVVHDPRTGTHRTIAAFRSKYQIQATDKSLADTKERAQKLIEEEKNRGIKDVTKHRQKASIFKTGATGVGSASSSRNASPLLTRALDSSSSRISPNKFANPAVSNNNSSQQNNGSSSMSRATPTQHLNSELRKKKLRQRIIQLVVLGKFSGADLVLRQLRKDGLNEEADIERRVEDIVGEVSEPSGSGSSKITLKPSLYAEVDTRWLWYNQEEKAYVRRVTQGLSSTQTKSTTFAPTRKSGIERMQAPSHSSNSYSSTSGNTVSPEAIPTPPNSRPASAVSGHLHKTSKHVNAVPNGCREQTPNTYRSPHHEVSSASKRKAHVPAGAQQQPNETKRPRQESASPPEDPTSHPQHNHIEHNIQVRFAHFEKDPEFIKTRQRYTDLHSKLAVLKSRISDFERNQDMAVSASTAMPMDLCDLE
ncbi:unnamed protein product [Angiostrongylus costaricensis]|uniref:ELL domain-containing protein n=1 Tax=Angiostrongylus costaricensis TaxID=334426 RepID=A0A158PH39_ANGCS|nr:unnamed protein product [Angiostrongylus costaricensis]